MIQAAATRTPLARTSTLGPKRSTRTPEIGATQVSVTMKMVKATWIAALPQWYLTSIGSMKSVQPYCRLAIITRQMMPRMSWPQRVHRDTDADAARAGASEVVVMSTPHL
jgi:hypothetical protein